jgi:DNA-binding transcriptional regulator YiaG
MSARKGWRKSRTANVSPAEETRACRQKLGLTRTAFARALQLGPRGYDQVRKWEEGVVPPNTATLTAMRLLVELHEAKRLSWMSAHWTVAQRALDDLLAMYAHASKLTDRRTFVEATQVLRLLLEQRPK